MAIQPVLMFGNETLRQQSSDVNFDQDNVHEIIEALRDTLRFLQKEKQIGRALAAPQIGILKKVVFMETEAEQITMINPGIVEKSIETFQVWDSCFSADVAFFGLAERSKKIKVEYLNESQNIVVRNFSDDLAELFQHEIDHLHGILFTDHVIDNQIIMRSEWERLYR